MAMEVSSPRESEPEIDVESDPAQVAAPLGAVLSQLAGPITFDLRSLAILRLALAAIVAGHLVVTLFASGAAGEAGAVEAAVAGGSFVSAMSAAPGAQGSGAGESAVWWMRIGPVAVGLVAATLLAAGYRSRLMAAICLAAVVAGHRLVHLDAHWADVSVTAGLAALVLALLTAALMPIGARYSLDSAVNTTPAVSDRHRSAITLAALGLFLAMNLGPTFAPPPHLFAGPHAVATANTIGGPARIAAPAAARHPAKPADPADLVDRDPRTLTASYLEAVRWLPAAVPDDVDLAILVSLALLLAPVFQGLLRGTATLAMAALHLLLAPDFPDPLLALVLAAMWLALVPPGLWDALFRRLRTPERLGLTIWYHGGDPAHLRRVRLLATFLLIPETSLRRSDEDVDIDVYRRQRDSWVVTDHLGYRCNRFRAFAAVCGASPLLFPLAPILSSGVGEAIGDWFYDLGKRHRGPLTRLADRLRFRAISSRIPLWQQLPGAAALVLLFAWFAAH